MIKRVTLLAVLLMLGLSVPVFADETGTGVIEGQLHNGTIGGGSVAGQDVNLKVYLDEAEIDSVDARTDDEGLFVFNGLQTLPGYSYEVVAIFQGAEYQSEPITFGEGEITKSIGIMVYDSTTSDEAIKVAMSHMIVYVEEDTLLVKEYYLFLNEADRTYIGVDEGEDSGALRFSLPSGAAELQGTLGLMECCIILGENGFMDTMSVLPGMKEIAYSYMVSPGSGKYSFTQALNYPTSRFDLLVLGEDIEITSTQLNNDEPMDIGGAIYNHLSGQGFARGQTVEINLSGLPGTSAQGSILWGLVVLVGVVAGFAFVYLMRKRRPQPVADEGGPETHKQRLLAELAAMDDDFEDGRIPEATYRKLRAEKKAELVRLIQESKG